jgi:hypothetical protein
MISAPSYPPNLYAAIEILVTRSPLPHSNAERSLGRVDNSWAIWVEGML